MTTLRAWLADPNPASRRQARLGQAWLAWLRIRRNNLAMAGLILVSLLLVVAALAPWIAPHDPFVQNSLLNLDGISDGSITVIDLEKGGQVMGSIDTLKAQGFNPNCIMLLPNHFREGNLRARLMLE